MASTAEGFRPGDDVQGHRSVRVQADLRKAWKKKIKKLPPVQREAWLKSQEGIATLGAQACHQLRGLLEKRLSELVAGAASGEWVSAWVHHGELPPGLDFDARGRLVGPAGTIVRGTDGKPVRDAGGAVRREWPDGRRHAVRLVLSRVATSSGVAPVSGADPCAEPVMTAPTRRWTPPQAVVVEDTLDGMNWREALAYEFPASPSARVFQAIEAAKGREKEQRPKAVSRKRYRQMKRQMEARGETVD